MKCIRTMGLRKNDQYGIEIEIMDEETPLSQQKQVSLKDISLPVAALILVVSLCLLPLNNVFRGKIEELRKG